LPADYTIFQKKLNEDKKKRSNSNEKPRAFSPFPEGYKKGKDF
jgi:hypothetical protein